MNHRRSLLLFGMLFPVLIACAANGGDEAEPAEDSTAVTTAEVELANCFLRGATVEEAEGRTSPLRRVEFSVGDAEALLCHGAPSARDREVFGGLVPFGELWRMGANEPTTIHLTSAARIGTVDVEPGSYSIYALPGESEWEVFVNSNFERWGIPISDQVRATEVGSFTVPVESLDEHVETLTFDHEDGALVLEWEMTRVRIPVGAAM